MFEPKNFAARVLELRIQRKISQKQLGEAVGLSHKSISTIESGLRTTSLERLVAMADFFDVSTDYLLGQSDNPKRL